MTHKTPQQVIDEGVGDFNMAFLDTMHRDDGYSEEREVLSDWLRTYSERLVTATRDSVITKYTAWCPQCGDALEQDGTKNDYSCFGCGDVHYKLTKDTPAED